MVYISVLFQWSVFIFLFKQGESCDGHDWIENGGNCYKIFTDVVNKSVAESTCLEHGSALASISNVDEHSFLVTHLSQINTSQENFWIGLHKIRNQLLWNNRAPAGNLPWVDASVASSPGSRDCFIFNSARVLPFDCSATASFVCEQWKLLDTRPLSCPAGTYTDLLSEKCFWYTHMPLTKAGSEVICSLKRGHLLIPRGELFPVGIGVILMVSSPPQPILLWTSLVVNNGSFLFEDGTEFKHEDFTLRPGEGDCVALALDQGSRFELHQKPCLEEATGFCEIDTDSSSIFSSIFGTRKDDDDSTSSTSSEEACPSGNNWKKDDVTGFCYWETSYETARLSWRDARLYCQGYGGDLASFHSPEEEGIGLGLQFGSTEHSFWIGLRYDADTDSYVWVDGSPMNYTNWDDGQPDHSNRRLLCGYMSTIKKKWVLSYCGVMSWFICKAPKRMNPPEAVPPTREPLIKCPGNDLEYYFNDYCYQKISLLYGWHRAQQYCEDHQSNLVSMHSTSEVDFIIRILDTYAITRGNRVWIGLNSLGLEGSFRWSDGSPVDFTSWNTGEPNNFQNQEKCVNSYIGNGMWNDENCNALMNFVCKRRNGTFIQPSTTTLAPVLGYCQKDWYMFGDRCFQLHGLRKTQRKKWSEASLHCLSLGGFLVSISGIKDQAFMLYLVHTLKMDTWLGLHDSIHSGVFFWNDNSPLFYTNWAPGEPSSHGFQEDCAVISYGDEYEGKWKDTDCQRELPYVCQTHRDVSLTEPGEVRGTRCPHLSDYMKQGNSCYKLFTELKTWKDAQDTCRRDGAYLVSISDKEKQAVVGYLAAMKLNVSDTFWIGLKNTRKYPLQWENEFPMSFTTWGQNEPSIAPQLDASCYYSTISGYWKGTQCSEKKAFVCHHTADKPPKPVTRKKGPCPDDKSSEWYEVGNSCMFFGTKSPAEWHSAKFLCSVQGSHLASFHSMDEIKTVEHYMGGAFSNQLFFIGLGKNSKGGFQWSDNSPVDFVNWDQDEPTDGDRQCVSMRMDTMKWKLTDCYYTQYYICSRERENINSTDAHFIGGDAALHGESSSLHPGVVVAIIIGLIILMAVAALGIVRYRSWKKDWNRYKVQTAEPIRSFENQTYDDLNNLDIHDRNVLYLKD